ncbi:DsbA family oxidoreductase [Paenibacillus sp. J2TS4]|uniref:DsbA family oxidoreductase n=1 Tax=Paenibacillus sp. J2TS4 TaxID=2807194 RepID=UPI001B08BA6A|nr:DsbA family oxidoreductase [Paenibacillus sp. J2TS4]GIP34487.1 DSBA oxidoreductase [Paenibacillus sp. J2TS4]
MRVDIWSDYVCPFCYIGKRRFEMALNQFPHRDQVQVVYRSFQLDPNTPRDVEGDMHQVLADKYGMSREKAKAMNEQVAEQARGVGLDYHFDTMLPTNTRDAHRLTHYAKQHGKMSEMTERLLHAYFTESLHIGDHPTLAKLAAEVGLNADEATAMLSGDEYAVNARQDQEEAARLGVSGVPFFVFNNKYAVSGAQSSESFAQVLNQVWEEEQAAPVLKMVQDATDSASDDGCSDGSCSVPK